MNIGCTSFSSVTEDGFHLLSRTYDFFGDLSANRISVIRSGSAFSLGLADGSETYTSKYGFLGMAIQGLKTPFFVDGLNEKGLMGCLLNFPDFGRFNTNRNASYHVHPGIFTALIFASCATVEEVASFLSDVNITDEPVYGSIMSCHYIFSDRSGETIIVEPLEDGIKVYRDTIGVMANSPAYDWHLTNLRNYISVDNEHPEPRKILGKVFSAIGNGTGGSFGLPGGYASPARFVRLVFAKEFAPAVKGETEGVVQAMHSLSSVDVPPGFLQHNGGCEATLCYTSMCSESLMYYYSPASNRRINAISLKRALEKGDAAYEIASGPDILFQN